LQRSRIGPHLRTPESGTLVTVDAAALNELTDLADLLAQRNALDARIGAIIGRPALVGHIGEWIASKVFDIQLEDSAVAKAIDGRFRSGPLAGKTVNVKFYGKREGLLDTNSDHTLDYYLVLCGPKATTLTSKGGTRPLRITHVYLFDAAQIRTDQRARGTKSGVASSIRSALWTEAEIYPRVHPVLELDAEQCRALALFDWST
jgi:hypothetical protein